MKKMPEILIVTPTLNQGKYIEQTINSVISQNYENKRYVVLDGGSTDGSVDIIKRYASNLTYWDIKEGETQSQAIARGFNVASGEILGWLNSDDMLLPYAMETVGSFFASNPSAAVLVGASIVIDADGKPVRNKKGEIVFNPGINQSFLDLLYNGCWGFNQPAVFWRRTIYEKAGGIDQSFNFSMDYDLFLRMAKIKRFSRTRRFLACFRIHGQAKTATLQSTREKEDTIIRKKHSSLVELPYWLKVYLAFSNYRKRLLFWYMRFCLRKGIINMPVEFDMVIK